MTINKLDPNTPNNDVGLYFGKTRRVVIDTPFSEPATMIKAEVAGVIVWRHAITKELNVWELEADETVPVFADMIAASGTVDGSLETTSASNMFWGTAPNNFTA